MEREDAQSIGELLWCHRGHEFVGERVVRFEVVEVPHDVLHLTRIISATTACRDTLASRRRL